MALPDSAPGSVWYWKTDQGNWKSYPPTICRALDDAHQQGSKKHPVDGERFVDTVAMLQKRFDLTGKPRSVKREFIQPLKHHIVYVAGQCNTLLLNRLSNLGGIVTPFLTCKVSLVICDDPDRASNEIRWAVAHKIIVSSSHCLNAMPENPDVAHFKPFLIDISTLPPPSSSSVPNGTNTSSQASRAAPPLANGTNQSSSHGHNAIPKAPEAITMNEVRTKDLGIKSGQLWMGGLLRGGGNSYPIVMEVLFNDEEGNFFATLSNPVLTNTPQHATGKLSAGKVKICLTDPKIPHTTSVLTGDYAEDTNSISLQESDGPVAISLSRTGIVSTDDLPFLLPGTEWQGEYLAGPEPFKFNIRHRSGDVFKADAHWQRLDVTSAIEGQMQTDGSIKFREVEMIGISGEENGLDSTYTGRPSKYLKAANGEPVMEGVWKSSTASGFFHFSR